MTLAARLPEYPWDELEPIAEKARAFPGGLVDLSVGTPVDAVPTVIQDALAAAANAPGYPLTAGTPELRSAAAQWLARSLDVHVDPVSVLPVIGTKEFIAWLPTMLGLGRGDTVLYPSLAYPTYDIGARLAGAGRPRSPRWRATPCRRCQPGPGCCGSTRLPTRPAGCWRPRRCATRSPGRGRGTPCSPPTSATSNSAGTARRCRSCTRRCAATRFDGVLAVFSLSKRSNLAGYRAGFVTGDPALMKDLLLVGRQAGMIMPAPVQAAMVAALSDDAHAADQKARYAARRAVLVAGLTAAGFRIEHSEAGLYLWASRPGLDCWAACQMLADECGMLVGPGSMYGQEGGAYIRVALTATDERVAAAGERLHALAAR